MVEGKLKFKRGRMNGFSFKMKSILVRIKNIASYDFHAKHLCNAFIHFAVHISGELQYGLKMYVYIIKADRYFLSM